MKQTAALIQALRTYNPSRLAELMSISPALADLNPRPHRGLRDPVTGGCRSAGHPRVSRRRLSGTRRGDLDPGAGSLRQPTHLRILSGLYGILRPLDAILPHRLEMGTAMPVETHKNLYKFWGNQINQLIHEDLAATTRPWVLNLASNEYFKSVGRLDCPVVAPAFKEFNDGQPKMVPIYAKIARGTMASWVIRGRVRTTAKLFQFAEEGYRYDPSLRHRCHAGLRSLIHLGGCVLQPRIVQSETFHFLVQRRSIDVECFGGRDSIPIVGLQRLQNNLSFRAFHGLFQRHGCRRSHLRRQAIGRRKRHLRG